MNTKQRWVAIATAFVLGLGFFYNAIQFMKNANTVAEGLESLLVLTIAVLVVGVGGLVWFRKD